MTNDLTPADWDAISGIVDAEGRPASAYEAIASHFLAQGYAMGVAAAIADCERQPQGAQRDRCIRGISELLK